MSLLILMRYTGCTFSGAGVMWARRVTGMGNMRAAYRVLVGKLESGHLEDLNVGAKIVLKWNHVDM
jgi:hypothetical protein